jgi:hypothetical protein
VHFECFSPGTGLVKASAAMSYVGQYSKATSLAATVSLTEWCWNLIYFLLLWWTGFFINAMLPSLSVKILLEQSLTQVVGSLAGLFLWWQKKLPYILPQLTRVPP